MPTLSRYPLTNVYGHDMTRTRYVSGVARYLSADSIFSTPLVWYPIFEGRIREANRSGTSVSDVTLNLCPSLRVSLATRKRSTHGDDWVSFAARSLTPLAVALNEW